ncbi:hypothetical protein [Endozoicomonas sp. ONNA2]|uniref:hypothetical protein n=1 Tax=Endozoicomonas sp. ONNA2 TaxID=2828741 RepID=UPI00214987EC|nr:hypothetical protein [Endozoicomonas sp. ONNA2]
MAFDLETCRSKDELESFARQMFNVELDKRKKLDELKDEVRLLMNGGDLLKESEELEESVPSAKAGKKPLQFVLNKNTNSVFIYNPKLKKRMGVDLEFCDQRGNRL